MQNKFLIQNSMKFILHVKFQYTTNTFLYTYVQEVWNHLLSWKFSTSCRNGLCFCWTNIAEMRLYYVRI